MKASTMKKLIFCTLFVPVDSSATTIGLHLGSVHDKPGFNDTNPGIYLKTDSGITVGTVYNSVRKQGFYAGYTFVKMLTNSIEASVTLGGITGYKMTVTPMVIPSVAYKFSSGYSVRSAFLAKINSDGANAVTFMLEKSF
jgi:hypothetical protein